MQHTDKYNFNLIETSDPFSPDALNENTQKVEDVLATHKAVVDSALKSQKLEWEGADETLDGRLSALEQGRMAYKCGSYTGDGTFGKDHPTRLEFDFKPDALFIWCPSDRAYGGFWWLRGMRDGYIYINGSIYNYVELTWEDRAIRWYNAYNSISARENLNTNGVIYNYLALGSVE